MDQERAIELLLDRTAAMQAEVLAARAEISSTRVEMAGLRGEIAGIRQIMATKQDLESLATKHEVAELRQTVREGTKAMRDYTSYVGRMLNAVTKGQLSLEEQVEKINLQMDTIQQRVSDLEKRNPAA